MVKPTCNTLQYEWNTNFHSNETIKKIARKVRFAERAEDEYSNHTSQNKKLPAMIYDVLNLMCQIEDNLHHNSQRLWSNKCKNLHKLTLDLASNRLMAKIYFLQILKHNNNITISSKLHQYLHLKYPRQISYFDLFVNIFFPNAIFCHNKYLVMSPFSNYIPILYKYLPNNLFPLTVLYNPRTCEQTFFFIGKHLIKF